ncbi:acetylornithine transaminase [Enterococcus larvae]|uniref:acetylornithine transaminase n=1 Tax=Enterococcus larvae TaxID=2794352 RepID=UPI003F32E883
MTYLFPNYSRKPIEFIKGEKNHLFDKNGKKYLDFTSGIGVMNLGYDHPVINQVLQEQAAEIWHTPNLYENSLQEEAAKLLAGEQDYLAYFCNSGAEANEAAIKLARKATGRSKIITFEQSFHGRTFGAMSATGQAAIHRGFYPLLPEFVYVPFNSMEMLKRELDQHTAAVMLELIQGEGGVIPAEEEWIKELAEICEKNGSLLIVDEVQTGIGRTGTFYASEAYGIEPDIITLAKGLGNGFPVGAMLGKGKYADVFQAGSHGSTFGGNKLGMAVAGKVVELVRNPEFLVEADKKGTAAIESLKNKLADNSVVVDVRGKGLMIGIQLTDSQLVGEALEQLEQKGIMVLKAGTTVLRLLPPLTIAETELSEGIEIICQVLEELAYV